MLFQNGALFTSLTVAREHPGADARAQRHLPPELMDELPALKIELVGLPAEAGRQISVRSSPAA